MNNGSKEDDSKDEVFFGPRPVERIIWVFGRLRCEDDVRVFPSSVLQSASLELRTSSLLIQKNRPWYVTGSIGFENSKRHGCQLKQ